MTATKPPACRRCGGTGVEKDHLKQGTELRKARIKSGLSLHDMARRLKFSVAYLSDLELGRRGWRDELVRRYREKL